MEEEANPQVVTTTEYEDTVDSNEPKTTGPAPNQKPAISIKKSRAKRKPAASTMNQTVTNMSSNLPLDKPEEALNKTAQIETGMGDLESDDSSGEEMEEVQPVSVKAPQNAEK